MSIFIQSAQLAYERSTQEPTSSSNAELVLFDQQKCIIEKNAWSLGQNTEYVNFLATNRFMFANKETRRSNKVFRLISQKIRTRTIHQVKSHHQKMLKKHKSIDTIIEFLLHSKKPLNNKNKSENKACVLNQDEIVVVQQEERLFEKIELQMGISLEFRGGNEVQESGWFVDL